MADLLDNPLVQAAVAPFLVAFVVAVCLWRTRLIGLALSAALLMVVGLTIGFSFEVLSGQRKLVLVAIAATLALPVLEFTPLLWRQRARWSAAAAAGVAAVWTVLRVLQQHEAASALAEGSAAAVYMALLVGSTQAVADDMAITAASALGLGLASSTLALFGASALLAQVGGSIAAASGAVLLLLTLLPRPERAPWTLAFPAAIACGLICLLAVFAGMLPWYCILPTLAVPWITRLTAGARLRPAWQANALAVGAALLPVAAGGLAAWLAGAANPV